MTFQDVLEQGAICGLKTVDEALLQFELHATQLVPYTRLADTLRDIEQGHHSYLEAGGGPDIPQNIIDRMQALILTVSK